MFQRRYQRHRRFVRTGAVVAGLMLLSTPLASATPTATPMTNEPSSTAGQEAPALTAKVGLTRATLDRLRAEGQAAGSPKQVPVPPSPPQDIERSAPEVPATGGRALTLIEAETMSRQAVAADPQPESSPRAVNQLAATPIGEQPDQNLVNECFNGSGVEGNRGRVHNRFTHCQRAGILVDYWEVDNSGVPVEHRGTTTAKIELFTQGDETQRRVRVFARLEKDSVDYDWGVIDNIFTAPNVPLSLIGQCLQSVEVCHATRSSATMPWVVWDNSTSWAYWDVYNHEEIAEGRDLISFNQWTVEYFTDGGGFQTLIRGRTAPRIVRCDSATYFNRFGTPLPQACVFDEVIPHLNYQLGSTHHSVAFHIFTAQFHPNDTYPTLVPPGVPPPRDKRIPGRYIADNPDAPGLHRITDVLHPGQVLANRQHVEGACFKTGPNRDEYLDTGLPVRPNTPAEQCDEYPFASTLEGAAHPFWDFSVKAVPQTDNSVAGGLLITYYVNDRVLAWDADLDDPDEVNDRFYVNIE